MLHFDSELINPHLSCRLCKGYLKDPHTIKECLHSFCKSCLFKFIDICSKCPTCGIRLSSHPHALIVPDRTKQELVAKIFPDVLARDVENERQFYLSSGLEVPPDFQERYKVAMGRLESFQKLQSMEPHSPLAEGAAPSAEPPKLIKFRLEPLLHGQPTIGGTQSAFSVPRNQKIKKCRNFLTKHLNKHSGENGLLELFVDGQPIGERDFLNAFPHDQGLEAKNSVVIQYSYTF